MNHIEHIQALATELAKIPSQRNTTILEAARTDLAQMTDEDIQTVMNLVQPGQSSASAVGGNVIAMHVDNQHLRRAIGVGVAMAGERTLDRVMEIYAREHKMVVSDMMLRDIVELQISWFFDVLWDRTWDWSDNRKGYRTKDQPRGGSGIIPESTAMMLLRDFPNTRAYAAARILKLWETASTIEDKGEALGLMYYIGAPEFLDAITAAFEEPSLVMRAINIISDNHYKFWTVNSNRVDLQKRALLIRKILDIYKTSTDQKTRDFARETYCKVIIHEQKDRDAFLINAMEVLAKAETEVAVRILHIDIVGRIYGYQSRVANQKEAIKYLVDKASKHSNEAVKEQAQVSLKRIQQVDNPPKQEPAKNWADNF
ncbi:MAG TPA: hypothetical protein VHL11_11500 [Phototrophicaceae bacterium]|nr:hypothetical protein [Phototrophicaceae bacterium]